MGLLQNYRHKTFRVFADSANVTIVQDVRKFRGKRCRFDQDVFDWSTPPTVPFTCAPPSYGNRGSHLADKSDAPDLLQSYYSAMILQDMAVAEAVQSIPSSPAHDVPLASADCPQQVPEGRVMEFSVQPSRSSDALIFTPQYGSHDCAIYHKSPITVQPEPSFEATSSILEQFDGIEVRTVAFGDVSLRTTWFSFEQPDREIASLFNNSPAKDICQKEKRTQIQPLKQPLRPPELSHASLEQRLKWLLSPPIHEVLSDPTLCLPERPFPFQAFGIKWLLDRDEALLADEMGLGKTMQAIIAARLLWKQGSLEQVLIVCPKSLITNWKNEICKWWPQAEGYVLAVENDRRWLLKMESRFVLFKIINYEAICRDMDWICKQSFSHSLVIIDEAQRIKNPDSKTAKAVKALGRQKSWALTGTPLENKVEDVKSIFGFVSPGLDLDPWWQDSVRDKIAPYLLRRRTEEVLDELPLKSEQDVEIVLSPEHQERYIVAEKQGVFELDAKGDSITVTHVFALINKLRQLCNFDVVDNASAKMDMLLEDMEEISESGRKALIFSQFVNPICGIRKIANELRSHGLKTMELHGQVKPSVRDQIIKDFQSDKGTHALLLNYAVGGVGLNLQAANYVYLYDRWWNPAVEDQAIKRAHRLGQKRKVFVRRFFCKDTIEERILQKLAEKRRLFRNVIDGASPESDSMGLSQEELFSLFDLKVRPRVRPTADPRPRLVIGNMSPEDFEVLVSKVYEKLGFRVRLTPRSHDQGVDVFAERNDAEGVHKIAIQCKHQKSNVGRPALQQLWGVLAHDPSLTRGDLVSSSGFTKEARRFADGKRLWLIDRKKIVEMIRENGVADV